MPNEGGWCHCVATCNTPWNGERYGMDSVDVAGRLWYGAEWIWLMLRNGCGTELTFVNDTDRLRCGMACKFNIYFAGVELNERYGAVAVRIRWERCGFCANGTESF